MGLFLSAAGIANVASSDVARCLANYAFANKGTFDLSEGTPDDGETLGLRDCGDSKISILFPHGFYEWDYAVTFLSRSLNAPAFSFHIHDGDLWMYRFWDRGNEVDRFNPLPEYWGELDPTELAKWKGDAEVIAAHWHGINSADIERYLRQWDPSGATVGKAYPDDEFSIGEDWQMVDFMRRLGLSYPLDDGGRVVGMTYRFVVLGRPEDDPESQKPIKNGKPWWRLW